jgi:hypothetical protein
MRLPKLFFGHEGFHGAGGFRTHKASSTRCKREDKKALKRTNGKTGVGWSFERLPRSADYIQVVDVESSIRQASRCVVLFSTFDDDLLRTMKYWDLQILTAVQHDSLVETLGHSVRRFRFSSSAS